MHEPFRHLSLPHLFRKPGTCAPSGYEFVGTIRDQSETIFQALADHRCRLIWNQKITPDGKLPEGHVVVVRLIASPEVSVNQVAMISSSIPQKANVFEK